MSQVWSSAFLRPRLSVGSPTCRGLEHCPFPVEPREVQSFVRGRGCSSDDAVRAPLDRERGWGKRVGKDHKRCGVPCLVAQSCLTLCDPTDCSPPGSSVPGDSPDQITGGDRVAVLLLTGPNQKTWGQRGAGCRKDCCLE